MQNVSQFRDRVARVVVDLNNRLADSQSGSLIQIWMPDTLDGNIVLQTQGLPYAVTGTGDLLALFRCVSCRYHFSTDPVMQPKLLGAVGRVYTSLEPEMCNDLQKYNKQVYLRVNEAQRCRVHSTLVMPFFDSPSRDRPIGVLEVVKNSKSVQFNDLVEKLTASLARVNLYCADIDCRSVEVGLREWPLEVDVSVLDMGAPRIQDVTEAADGSGTGESLSEGAARPKRLLLNSARSQEADNTVSSEPEKESAEAQDEKCSSPAQPLQTQCGSTPNLTTLPHGGSAPNLTTLSQTVQQDMSGSKAEHAQVPGGRYNGVNYHYSPYMTPISPAMPVNGNSAVTYASGGHFVGMQPVAAPLVPFGVPQQYANGMAPAEQCMPPTAVGHITNSQDLAQAMVHLQNFHNLLQELRPGSRKSKGDSRKSKTSMGTGRHLTFDDLKRHMNVGLKEAAAQLGICPTTLKRACRRNGITRWPCRQLAKLNKTMSELGYKGPPPDGVLESALRGQLRTSSLSKELSSGDSTQAASQPSRGSALDIETRLSVERTLSGPCSAPACLDLLGDAEGQLLGSSSSQGLLSAVLGDQEYDWPTTGDDADDDIGADDEDDKPSVSESAPSGGPLCSQSSMATKASAPFPASSSNFTFMMGSPEILSTKVPGSAAPHTTTTMEEKHDGTPEYISDGLLSFADILKDGFDVNQLDIDADMPDLVELGQAAS